jgi:hypothetical protein
MLNLPSFKARQVETTNGQLEYSELSHPIITLPPATPERWLTEDAFPLTDGRASSAVRYWTRIAQAAPSHMGLVEALSETLVTRNRPERVTSVAAPGLIDLVQAAAHLQAKRLTRPHALTAS